MPGQKEQTDVGIAIVVLRMLRGWERGGLADAAGLSASSIYRYEIGNTIPTRKTFERIVAAVGIPIRMADRLVAWIRSARAAWAGSPEDAEGALDALCGEVSEGISRVFRSAAALVLAGQPGFVSGPWRRQSPPSPGERQQAAVLWGALERRDTPGRRMLVQDAQEYRNWALCERVCAESTRAAADDAGRAVELAELAVLIADLAPGEESWRWRLRGYAAAHRGNARRVGGDLPGADEAFRRALEASGRPDGPAIRGCFPRRRFSAWRPLYAPIRTVCRKRLPFSTALWRPTREPCGRIS